MEWLERMNHALDYIEENLKSEIDYKKIAQAACCSEYHFPRMFSALSGITLSEYIRRRRLTLAAFEWQKNDPRILDLALTYRYESADSFSRAFQKTLGLKPLDVRNKGKLLKAFPRISFQLSIKGAIEMEYRIERIDFELSIIGKGAPVKTSQAAEAIPALWHSAQLNGLMQKLIDLSWENPKCTLESLLGICGKQAAITEDEFTYFMGIRYDGHVPDGMDTLVINHRTWAVFPNIESAWKRLYAEWLPASGYELADLPCIECYYPPNHQPENELWVPVVSL
ncbi:AraC family transcriptional regulator [Pseudobacillus badius]|uniref:AraC family transcriptional regulator n=1 Tax=Bacillus badius TaxID=1455 RepID=UPI0007B04C76|nr:AraC family transcriptional regulator [Bacillus badius]KZO01802.1 AraC family transcriptional regulator [Bacillus badius]OCS90194.1 AraC family transcriptional regulator [Bacillus badius]OVE53723.1 AraC family transcriptional regulator [Bacillus badius]TDW06106.1 AraC family transcriptional regulator [Bacillus badius]